MTTDGASPEALAEATDTYRRATDELARLVRDAIVPWIERVLTERIATLHAIDDELAARIRVVAETTRDTVVPKLDALFATDVDRQSAVPLGLLRDCVGPANALLDDLGIEPPKRDPVTASMFPDDPHGLGPARFDDVAPELHEPGLVWGAAKAHLVLTRHRPRGGR